MVVKRGVTRLVFVLGSVVVKVPNFTYSWLNFLTGLCANMNEAHTWKYNSGECCEQGKSYLLCPVLWCSWGGWLLVMPRVDMERHRKEVGCEGLCSKAISASREKRYKSWIDAGFGGDDKPGNYGYYKDRLVKVDYA